MAKLSAGGRTQLLQWERPTARFRLMSDGVTLRNAGYGWKVWRRIKRGVPVEELFRKRQELLEQQRHERPDFHEYADTLAKMVSLKLRGYVHSAVSMLPDDADGVYSELVDHSPVGDALSFEDCEDLCWKFRMALREAEKLRSQKGGAA